MVERRMGGAGPLTRARPQVAQSRTWGSGADAGVRPTV
jgi:hypothetical protein